MSILIPILDDAIRVSKEEEYFGKKKTSFWASETEIMAFDVYHRFLGTKPTNPITEEKLMMLLMRKLTEKAIVDYLRKSGKLIEKFANDERCYFEWGPNKVPISGYPDAGININDEEILIEVKTYYGSKAHSEARSGRIKSSYLKQLAIYMYHFKISHGIVLMVNQGTGERFEYDLFTDPDEIGDPYIFYCPDSDEAFSLEETFKRFEKIWVDNVKSQKEPEIEYVYKYPIKDLNWDSLSADKIRKARNNKSVVGDWQIKYSDFKDLIIQKQGTVPGYTDAEIQIIRELTDGYSRRKSKQIKFDPKNLK